LGQIARDAAFVVGSGSLPGGLGDDFWRDAMRRSKTAGARFFLDSHDDVASALDEGVYGFRENRSAIADMTGEDVGWPGEVADWAENKVRSGAAELIIVTEGREGAVLVSHDARILQRPPRVEPRSAIGAGDSFVAGMCLALARGESSGDALKLAVASAAATLLSPGTELCRKEDVDRLIGECPPPESI
ncbi:MAG: 1-phosphofructokinase family hexose kinase, partial [Alphaproteobacteria bacterium]|nr:1-phosphofructokinase family hexose kinase [Alphaproteobacteria bacterium]